MAVPLLMRLARSPPATPSLVTRAFCSQTSPVDGILARRFGAEEAVVARLRHDSHKVLNELGDTSPANCATLTEERLRALTINQRGAIGVLFLCGHNAGRSQMAQYLAQHAAAEGRSFKLEAFSAGSNPGEKVNPVAADAMEEIGVPMNGAFPKPWTSEVASGVSRVITMGCGDQCPVLPGTTLLDWNLPDPHGQGIDAVRKVRDDLAVLVDSLMKDLESESVSG